MRIGILANSLPAALSVYGEAGAISGSEVFVLLFPAAKESQGVAKHLARLFLKSGRCKSLRTIAERRVFVFRRPLNHPQVLSRLRSLDLDVGLHKSGNIYRDSTISCFRLGILNAHIGLLPKYRGRSVMEWSLLRGDPVGISVFFIDEGIDTGERIVLSEEVSVAHCKSLAEARQYLFNLDAVFYRRALELLSSEKVNYQMSDGSGRRYYVMSKLFQEVAEECLAIRNQQSAINN